MEWLNYHHLLYFWTVVREGGVSRAAEKLRAVLIQRQAVVPAQAACLARLARLRSCGSRWRLRRRMFLGVTSTISSSSI